MLRREAIRVGGLTALGLGLADWLRLRAAAPAETLRAKSCILLWLDGGPSHLDTFDPKPDAPREVRGPFSTVATEVPGVRFCEHLPRTAGIAGRFTVLRSVTSPLGEHNFASHYLLTGFKPSPSLVYPSHGSVVAHETLGRAGRRALPPYIHIGDRPNSRSGPGYLPATCAPFVPGGDPARRDFRVRDLDPYPGITLERLHRRRDFRRVLDDFSRRVESSTERPGSPEFEQAYRLMTSPRAKRAFDLSGEPRALQDAYGPRTLGRSCLIARRLVERGVPFVTVTDRGWDTHQGLVLRLEEGYSGGQAGKIPTFDRAFSTLLRDLDTRGLLGETLVLAMGEFGRTPKINTRAGRDHWPRVFSVAAAGAGVPGGQVVGASDAIGEGPDDRPVSPSDLSRTIFRILGVDPDRELETPGGRPVRINRYGRVIGELLG